MVVFGKMIDVIFLCGLVITKKCPDPNCPPGFQVKEKKAKKGKMMSRFSDR